MEKTANPTVMDGNQSAKAEVLKIETNEGQVMSRTECDHCGDNCDQQYIGPDDTHPGLMICESCAAREQAMIDAREAGL